MDTLGLPPIIKWASPILYGPGRIQDSYPNGRKHHDTFPTCGSKNIDTTTAHYFPWLKAQHKVTLDLFVSLTHHGSNRNDKRKTEFLKRADSGMDSGLETTEDDQ
jgi:hypothetical protein